MKSLRSVEDYIESTGNWKKSLWLLREIILSTELSESLKWGAPIYTFNYKNLVGIAAFKSYAGLWFHQGALLIDKEKKLINAQEGVTKALRQWRFSSFEEIQKESQTIKEYIEEAILNQKQGKSIKPSKDKPLIIPDELNELFKSSPNLIVCFDSFSKSKKREFAEYISEAKLIETKQKRIDKITPLILKGIGLNDKYLN
ncbi:MAG: YdeI/OmpD-associated family protein [Bacteroidetes bacterium]|nr:YdeI/OmpD-associated family protein [Bacteroidota bacterium]